MNQQMDFTAMGRGYLQDDSYGIAAFCFYRALMENGVNENAWNGLILSLSLMRKEADAQTMLARFGLTEQPGYDRDLMPIALMLWQQNPGALGEWVRSHVNRRGVSPTEKEALEEMANDLAGSYAEMVERYGEEALKAQGILSLTELAGRRIEMDWIMQEDNDTIYQHIEQWLEDPEMLLTGIRTLCMLPDPRSEKLLRRVCRTENLDDKARTHALLALRWLGIRGNVRLHKFGESFVIDLNHPEPELTITVPSAYKPVLDRIKLWAAKQKGLIDAETYEAYASTDERDLPEEINAKLNEADVPSVYQEVSHMLIRAAYDQYYPLVPTLNGTRQWSAALLNLMKDYAEGIGDTWPFGEPELDDTSRLHRNWLLSASPDYYENIKEARRQREIHNGLQQG